MSGCNRNGAAEQVVLHKWSQPRLERPVKTLGVIQERFHWVLIDWLKAFLAG